MMKRDSHSEIFHTSGNYINDIKLPFEVKMFAGEDSGYDQYDPDFNEEYTTPSVEERLVDYYSESSLMSPRLVSVFTKLGVDNFQVFPVTISDGLSGEPLNFEYFFVNIVGLISCADLDTSQNASLGDTFYFHKLKINQEKAKDLLIFRLAESPMEIIVHEKIANIINNSYFSGLTAELCSD